MFKGIITVDGVQHLKYQRVFVLELVGACRTRMFELPVWRVTLDCGLHKLVHSTSNLKVKIEGDGELTSKILLELYLNKLEGLAVTKRKDAVDLQCEGHIRF